MEPGDRIQVAAEVTALLGEADVDVLARSAATGYRCVACGQDSQLAAEPATVVVRLTSAPVGPEGQQVAHVRLAHARCGQSRVIADPASLPVPPPMTMTATAAVIPCPGGRRPLLIAEPSAQLSAVTAGERTDLILAGLLGHGLHLLATAQEKAPHAPGWLVSLPSRAAAVIRDPSGGLFYAGELDQPRPWRRLAGRRGEVELLTGLVGFGGPGNRGASLLDALSEAARGGRLVGGTVAAGRAGTGRARPRPA